MHHIHLQIDIGSIWVFKVVEFKALGSNKFWLQNHSNSNKNQKLMTVLWQSGDGPVTGRWQSCDSPVTVLRQSGDSPVTVWWNTGDTLVTLHWHSGDTPVTLPWHSGDTPVTLRWQSGDGPVTFRWQSGDIFLSATNQLKIITFCFKFYNWNQPK